MAEVVSINKSSSKGAVKNPSEYGILIKDGGLSGDAHSADGHRQLSLLACESYDEMRSLTTRKLPYGIFAENITTVGISLHTLPVGTKLKVGDCEIIITQIGKECHNGCEIFKAVGKCVMPSRGVFAAVLVGGKVKTGDEIKII
jgi:MOSC domain-containing protein YiiM